MNAPGSAAASLQRYDEPGEALGYPLETSAQLLQLASARDADAARMPSVLLCTVMEADGQK
jgi:hypothetical protein